MRYAVIFLCLGIVYGVYAMVADNLIAKFISVSCAIAFSGVGLAYALSKPQIFFKRRNGKLSIISYILFWPYHALNFFGLGLFRRMGRENAYDKVADNLYLGCKLNKSDRKAIESLGVTGVLDLTCEFTEPAFLRQMAGYRCIPVLDTRAPSLEQLQETATWLEQQIATGPVYVHCAFGHSRSATFVAAYLLLTKQVSSVEEALDKIVAARPKAGFSPSQLAALKQFHSS